MTQKNWKKNDFAKKFFQKWFWPKKFKKMICKKEFFRNFKKMKNYFATKFFEKSQDVWTLSKWDWHKELFRSCRCVGIFGRTTEIVPSTMIVHQQKAMTRHSCTRFAFKLEPIMKKNCDRLKHSGDFLSSVRFFSRSYAKLSRSFSQLRVTVRSHWRSEWNTWNFTVNDSH